LGTSCLHSDRSSLEEVRCYSLSPYRACRTRFTLGRGLMNDLKVEDECRDKMISLQHAVILKIGVSFVLIDTSLNGTYVNRRRVRRCVLRMNDIIRLGKSRRKQSGVNFVFVPGRLRYRTPLAITDAQRSIPSFGNDFTSLKSALECPKCTNYMVIPTSVFPCNDHFCHECIEDHFRSSDQCPTCNNPVHYLAMKPNRKMTQIMDEVLLRTLPLSMYTEFVDRVNRRKSVLLSRHTQLKQLMEKYETVIDQTKSSSSLDPFLVIYQTWTQFERTKFSKGISNYPIGDARTYYCWIVGLTPEWIKHYASQIELGVAMNNLGISRPVRELSIGEMQNQLLRFIYSSTTT
jgi:hypothetical protein